METLPVNLGKIMIEINLDTSQYNIGFSNADTIRLLQQPEMQTIISPFHVLCIINELKRRKEAAGNKIIPVTQFNPNKIKQ